jgi:hypothetical protein
MACWLNEVCLVVEDAQKRKPLNKSASHFVMTAGLIAVSAGVYARSGRGSQPIRWQIAGSIFQRIEVTDLATGEAVPHTLLTLKAKGAPGPADLQAVGISMPVSVSDPCPEGTDLQFAFQGGFVATLSDLSMLFGVIDDDPNAKNALCVDYEGPATGVFDYVITGGTGRFEGAMGHVTVDVESWGVTSVLSAEDGSIVGTIELP